MDSRQNRLSSWQQQQAPVIDVPVPPNDAINIVTPPKAPVALEVAEPAVEPETSVDIVADVLADENPKVNNLKKLKKQD